jgi:phytoene synthase
VADRSYCAELVWQQDADRYLTALFAPPEHRQDLFAIYAFNAEVARGRESVSEPMLGQIRLQWWRDAIAEIYDGEPRRHQVVEPLASAIHGYGLPRALFDQLLDARELDLTDGPPGSLDQLVAYADASSGGLTRLALLVLGGSEGPMQTAGGLVGTAWALIGLMRALPHQLRQGRNCLPRDVMARHGVEERALRDMKPSDAVCRAVEEVCTIALEKLKQSRLESPGKVGSALPALLPATLADAYLARFSRLRHDPFDARNGASLRLRSWRLMARVLAGRY